MYNSLYVILILIIKIYNISTHISNPSRYCLVHLRHHQPSIGHYLLDIDHSINNEQACEKRCSIDHLCSTATFNRQSHRCHLFQHREKHSRSKPYRSNHIFSTFSNCLGKFSLSNNKQIQVSNVHCNYDVLPWQHAQTSMIFKSYTLIGISHLPCQELCSSIRYCAGMQYQLRGSHRNQCQLLRSTKPWDLSPSKTWTVFAKRSCHIQINENNNFLDQDLKPLCNFKDFGQGQHKHSKEIIHAFSHISEIQCQYLCSRLGIEFIERRSQCILLSPNFLQNDGSINVKYHRRHHIYLKMSCHMSKCSTNDIDCGCQQNPCHHGTCLSRQREGYQYMFCQCYHGFSGDLCDREIIV
ncbi:unnamed protein product [Adineta steineri]|uniref:EGF-like domain-containing protein n=1 Tax=Adineta steineri TaxID=433720 RepID=A0A815EQK4_9BILA|nr:unnamed protein product [Adineta steineri]CAF3651738.1 unnamed protein product [Adineta steineri]